MLNWLKEQNPEASTILLVKDFHKFYDDPTINRTTLVRYMSTLKKNFLLKYAKYIEETIKD